MGEPNKPTGDVMGRLVSEMEMSRQEALALIFETMKEYPTEPRLFIKVFGQLLEILNQQGVEIQNAADLVETWNRRRGNGNT